MLQAIGELLSSKKFLMMLIGVIVWFAGRYGINLDPATLYPPLALIATAIFGQAIADHGKSAAQITAGGPPDANTQLVGVMKTMAAQAQQQHEAIYGPSGGADPAMPPIVASPLTSVPPAPPIADLPKEKA